MLSTTVINLRDKKVLTVIYRLEKHVTKSLDCFNKLAAQSQSLRLNSLGAINPSDAALYSLKESLWHLAMLAKAGMGWSHLLLDMRQHHPLVIPMELLTKFDQYFFEDDTKIIAKNMLKFLAEMNAKHPRKFSLEDLLTGLWNAHVLYHHGLSCGYLRQIEFDQGFLLIFENYILHQNNLPKYSPETFTFFKAIANEPAQSKVVSTPQVRP